MEDVIQTYLLPYDPQYPVAAAMRELGLASRVAKGFKPPTTQADPTKQPAENKLDR